MICTWLRPGHLSVRVGDGSRRSEELVKNLELRLWMRLLLLLLLTFEGVELISMTPAFKRDALPLDHLLLLLLLLLLQRSTAVQVRSSVRLMPQNQPSGRGLLPSPTAWTPDQHPVAMLADVTTPPRRCADGNSVIEKAQDTNDWLERLDTFPVIPTHVMIKFLQKPYGNVILRTHARTHTHIHTRARTDARARTHTHTHTRARAHIRTYMKIAEPRQTEE